MEEFGRIDNHTSVDTVSTSELFASFITGKTYEEHGVTGVKTWNSDRKGRIIDAICTEWRRKNVRGFHRLYTLLKAVLQAERRWYDKRDLPVQTMFDEVPDSKALYVPGYNPAPMMKIGAMWEIFNSGGSIEESQELADIDHRERVSGLQNLLDEPAYNLAMIHLAKPDQYQHLYAGDKKLEDWDKIKKLYQEMDNLAASILEKATPKYDTVLFMSDHGLPTEEEHNENAFYSCTTDIFGEETPHITDFYDVVSEQTTVEQDSLMEEISY